MFLAHILSPLCFPSPLTPSFSSMAPIHPPVPGSPRDIALCWWGSGLKREVTDPAQEWHPSSSLFHSCWALCAKHDAGAGHTMMNKLDESSLSIHWWGQSVDSCESINTVTEVESERKGQGAKRQPHWRVEEGCPAKYLLYGEPKVEEKGEECSG